jgi:predicted metal-dependent hydrolase
MTNLAETVAASPDATPAPAARVRSPRAIPVRAMGFSFDESIPRWWFCESPIVTHLANGLNILFPAGEQFFIRSVKHYQDRIDDPELLARIRGFYGQEGRHGHEHERQGRVLEAQGYQIEEFLRWYETLAFERLVPILSPALRLSVTAALEHFTASMARKGLRGNFLDHAHPVMADLLRWHAAEEIEHKSVAYDVFMKVDGRYSVRVLGLGIALGGLMYFWRASAKNLFKQERARGTDLRAYQEKARVDPVLIQEELDRKEMFRHAIADYLRPDFHPDHIDDNALAKGYLASIGRLEG